MWWLCGEGEDGASVGLPGRNDEESVGLLADDASAWAECLNLDLRNLGIMSVRELPDALLRSESRRLRGLRGLRDRCEEHPSSILLRLRLSLLLEEAAGRTSSEGIGEIRDKHGLERCGGLGGL